ncbi:EF hand protein [Salinisphaera shabanensis E1L3A]|uniref:EF hand protein n=1 Tax=Salinisphaera shabanensis E1L3A TaxID=1033802 RepID=U2ESF3_9GAMM|nr:EF hand protein [Salinisphaera shabanensis]ERJ20630.1 EF hand protein [Salinisphaera shabanensis E1L3A]
MKKRYAVMAGIAIAIPFGTALSSIQATAAETASASWATMDADADGSLSPEEVSATPWEAKFDAMDENGDGQVDKDEFQSYMDDMQSSQDSEDR